MDKFVSGIKPTGELHIGNYFGAIKQFLELQDTYRSFIFVANYHALNQVQDPKKLLINTAEVIKILLSTGINPAKVVLFKQSDVPEVTELCWILNSICQESLLKRAHAYKDAVSKKKPVNMGLFDYPVLMAADILIYGADLVPVGKDQKQHLEITQELAGLFNKIYGETFKLPQAYINDTAATVTGIDGRKMSKSYGNTIKLLDNEGILKKKIMSIKTDSRNIDEPKDPENCNIFALHKLFSEKEINGIRERYLTGKISYKESKEILLENVNNFLSPIRKKKLELDKDSSYIEKVLADGANIAREEAHITMEKVRKIIGIKI